MTADISNIDERRRRLLWRASHRGVKEADLFLGGFVRDHVTTMSSAELDELEALINIPDPELMSWIGGEQSLRNEFRNRTAIRLLAYRFKRN